MFSNHKLHHSALRHGCWVVAFAASLLGRGQQLTWLKHYATPNTPVVGFLLATDTVGNIYGTGTLTGLIDFDGNSSPVLGSGDIVVAKWDSNGVNQWVRTVGGVPLQNDRDDGEFIHYEPVSDRIIVTGTYNSQADFGCAQFSEQNDQTSIFMACYETDGTCAWVRSVRGPAVYTHCLLSDPNGDLYWFGQSILASPQFVGNPEVSIPYGGFIARYDQNGVFKSAKRSVKYASVHSAAWVDSTHWLLSMVGLEGDELFGTDLGITDGASGVLALVDTTGSISWFRRHQGSTGDGNGSAGCAVVGGHAIVSGGFGGDFVFDGQTFNGSAPWSNKFLACYSLDGDPEWIIPFWTEGYCAASPIWVDASSTVYIMGDFTDTTAIGPVEAVPAGESSTYVARFDTLGNCLSAFYFGPSTGSFGSLAIDGDDLIISAPYTGNVAFGPVNLPATNSVMLAKLDTLTGYTGVGPAFMALHEDLLIRANPNNGLCTVQLPTHLQFTNGLLLSIFDQTGQLVQRVPVTMGNAGVQVDIQAQAKGLYHVELGDGQQRYTGTIVFE